MTCVYKDDAVVSLTLYQLNNEHPYSILFLGLPVCLDMQSPCNKILHKALFMNYTRGRGPRISGFLVPKRAPPKSNNEMRHRVMD